MNDPRIRGVCGAQECYRPSVVRIPRPSLDRCTKMTLGSAFRVGTVVEYKGITRIVQRVNVTLNRPFCCHQPGTRIVRTLDLGAPDLSVPWDYVKVIEY